MIEENRIRELLQGALPPMASTEPSRDLWPLVAARAQMRAKWSWPDLVLAAIAGLALLMFPEAVLFLAYHL